MKTVQIATANDIAKTIRDIEKKRQRAIADMRGKKLLTIGTNPKTAKSDKLGEYLTAIQYLWPSRELCPNATKECLRACLNTAGNPVYFANKKTARLNRTRFFKYAFSEYKSQLIREIHNFVKRCGKLGLKPAIRLNGTSDIVWETILPEIFDLFPNCQFYDYSKVAYRFSESHKLPRNYHLTFSRSGENDSECVDVLERRRAPVAVVFGGCGRTKPLPATWQGFDVVDGDTHDLTFIRGNCVIGLRAKGLARNEELTSNFVIWGN